jgi:hypothetical protein
VKKTFRFTNLKDLYLSRFLPLKLDTSVKRKTDKVKANYPCRNRLKAYVEVCLQRYLACVVRPDLSRLQEKRIILMGIYGAEVNEL